MKNRMLLLLLYCCSLSAMANICPKPLTLATTTQWYPYVYSEQGKTLGSDVALLQHIFTTLGCQLNIVHLPERRSLLEVSNGHFDIALGASRTRQREKSFYFSMPYRQEVIKIAFHRADKDITDSRSLQQLLALNKVIAINLAGWYGEDISKAMHYYSKFIHSKDVKTRMHMLQLARVDMVIDDSMVLCSELQQLADDSLTLHPITLFQTPIHFIFNKDAVSLEFIAEFDKVLQQMTRNKVLQQQLPQYCRSEIAP